jgi:hypothetical protein
MAAHHYMDVETVFTEKNIDIYHEDIAAFNAAGVDVLRADERDRFYVVRALPTRKTGPKPRIVLLAQLSKIDSARSDLLIYRVVLRDLSAALVALEHAWRAAYIPGSIWHRCESPDNYAEFVERANWVPKDKNRTVSLLLL